jgi:hypothetical protein
LLYVLGACSPPRQEYHCKSTAECDSPLECVERTLPDYYPDYPRDPPGPIEGPDFMCALACHADADCVEVYGACRFCFEDGYCYPEPYCG